MNAARLVIGATLAAGALWAPAAAKAAALTLDPASRLWFDGDSTLHTFQSTATRIDVNGSLDASTSDLRGAVAAGNVKSLDLTIPVADLKSGENGLDKNMRKALKADDHPTITFGLESYDLSGCAPKASTCPVHAKGKLQIAGVEREEDLAADVGFETDGLTVKGSKELLMSDFGIKPPTMMLGTIKVKDKIVVRYDIKLRSPGAAP
jgi:polyisoprenoid-binding protein YceI